MKELNSDLNIIVCQKSLISTWKEHLETNYSEYQLIIYRKKDTSIPSGKVIILITYDLIWRRPEIANLRDFTLVLDESSLIKNATAKRTKFIMKLNFENVILLSGTPCSGRYEELHTQCKLLGWNISKKLYWQQYIKFINMDVGGFKVPKVVGYKNVERLKQKLHDHGSIFMKTEEVFDLPEQVEISVLIENTKEYKKFKKDRLITINDTELVGDTSLTKMLYLRQLASQYNPNKLNALKDLLESTEDRVIIFYNFTEEMEQIEDYCLKIEKPISIVNGQTKDLENYKSKDNTVVLVQYQAGALGINLQKANKTIYYSLPLSAELWMQSKKRVHRIGQQRACFYWYLIAKNTIEEDILNTLKERKDYTLKLFEEGD
ncbi:DEAD/DEAH box helicase [uncultured Clostridium sp.]|uniref:helicase-related protein n=1 Tax=uncultured Clostridium sp. TaxID=59620 RepID=UPI0025911403|nr:DEAD/DEAH box helicase [uncultured Clostridium sp.]MDU1348303.1 DEAD/DEAH box helicase [Clostridium argentinense]